MKFGFAWLSILFLCVACGSDKVDESTNESDEAAHVVGDVLSGLDELAASTVGGLALQEWPLFSPTTAALQEKSWWPTWLSSAWAANCYAASFSSCSSSERTRTYNNCSISTAKLDGSVTMVFGVSDCRVNAIGESVRRVPDFTLTGLRGASLHVYADSGGGQTLTRSTTTVGEYRYQVSGLHRVATNSDNEEIFNLSFDTSTPIQVSGTTRSNRTVTGGALSIVNSVQGWSTQLSFDNLQWLSSSCVCPTSGSLSGSISGGDFDAEAISLTMTSTCGLADLTIGTRATETVRMDRCNSN